MVRKKLIVIAKIIIIFLLGISAVGCANLFRQLQDTSQYKSELLFSISDIKNLPANFVWKTVSKKSIVVTLAGMGSQRRRRVSFYYNDTTGKEVKCAEIFVREGGQGTLSINLPTYVNALKVKVTPKEIVIPTNGSILKVNM